MAEAVEDAADVERVDEDGRFAAEAPSYGQWLTGGVNVFLALVGGERTCP